MSVIEKVPFVPEMKVTKPNLATTPSAQYNVAIGYLRAFITVLVVAHHAALAYYPFAPPSPATLVTQPRWWQAFPVVDGQRWIGLLGWWDSTTLSSCP